MGVFPCEPKPQDVAGSKRAYTIIEVLVALAIISVVAAGLLSALMLSMRESKEGRERVVANVLAESTIDELLARPPGSTGPSPGWKADGEVWKQTVIVPVVRDGMEFETHYSMELSSPAEDTARVVVAWEEASGSKKVDFQVRVPHFNRPIQRTQPSKVEENWHAPPDTRKYPTDPAFDSGDNQHDTPTPPQPSSDDYDYTPVISCATGKADQIARVTQLRDSAVQTRDGLDQKAKDYAQKKGDMDTYVAALNDELTTLNQQTTQINDFLDSGDNPSGFSCPPNPTDPTPPAWLNSDS